MVEEKTLDQLKQEIAIAATTGDDNAFNQLIKEYNSRKADIAKALAEAARKEAEALAGDREKLATAIHRAVVKIPELLDNLAKVKATGFTFKVDSEGITYKSVALATPAIKTGRTGGGGGTGRTKAEYGLSMAEIVEKFGTTEEKAEAANLKTQGKEGRADSKLYQLQKNIRKRTIAEGNLQPLK